MGPKLKKVEQTPSKSNVKEKESEKGNTSKFNNVDQKQKNNQSSEDMFPDHEEFSTWVVANEKKLNSLEKKHLSKQ